MTKRKKSTMQPYELVYNLCDIIEKSQLGAYEIHIAIQFLYKQYCGEEQQEMFESVIQKCINRVVSKEKISMQIIDLEATDDDYYRSKRS